MVQLLSLGPKVPGACRCGWNPGLHKEQGVRWLGARVSCLTQTPHWSNQHFPRTTPFLVAKFEHFRWFLVP